MVQSSCIASNVPASIAAAPVVGHLLSPFFGRQPLRGDSFTKLNVKPETIPV
jgi:hypothetical protein